MSLIDGDRPTRQRRSRAEIDEIRDAIVAVIAENFPSSMTVRQVFYALVVLGAIAKTEAEYNGTVVRLLTEMRWDGTVDWDAISDASRWVHKLRSFDSIKDALNQTARLYRRNLWRDADDYVELWCEKEALAGVIAEDTYEFDVPLMVSRGFSSVGYLRHAAEAITRIGKPTWIYQFGDHDPSGVWISRQIEDGLRRHLDDIGEFDLDDFHFERVAVTEHQIKEWNLPTRPTKTAGNAHAKGFEGESVELDAIPIPRLHDLVRGIIARHIDEEQLAVLRAAEESEREYIDILARRPPMVRRAP